MTDLRRLAAAAAGALAVALLCTPGTAGAAEALYGVTEANELVTLHSDSPGAVRSRVPIAGLQQGEQVLALDVRPKGGQLYVLGSTSRVYVVNPASGAAHALGNPFSPALAGGNFGLDVDPVADRIRLVSDGRQNLRLNPEDGQVAGHDGNLAYAEGDPGAGTTPSFAAAAYTAEGKELVIDTARDVLAASASAVEGKLTTIGPLGVDLQEPVTFDIGADGRAWVAGRVAGTAGSTLFLADLATGKLAQGAAQPAFGRVLRGIGAAGTVPDDKQRPSVLASIDRDQSLRSLRRDVGVEVACAEACSLTATLRVRGRTLAAGEGALSGPGRVRIKMARTKAGTPRKSATAALTVVAVDAAGNRTTVKRSVRFEAPRGGR